MGNAFGVASPGDHRIGTGETPVAVTPPYERVSKHATTMKAAVNYIPSCNSGKRNDGA